MSHSIPRGFRLGGVHCGIKRDRTREDLTLVVSDQPVVAAGVYTQNLVFASPVALDRERTPSDSIRAVVVNSGNANACTGERGLADAERMCSLVGEACGISADQVLVMSTGIIGEFLPMDKIGAGIASVSSQMGDDEASLLNAARGLMTTDTAEKISSRTLTLGEQQIQITGLAKGAAMIGPNMATMLGLILTDASLLPQDAQAALAAVVDDSFNCISVEGHTSTNDTVLLLASGKSANNGTVPCPLEDDDLASFQAALGEVCGELARLIPADGEGATHLIAIEVAGCANRAAARKIAKTVADSALVKTAVAGADPNWGRIVSAAGYAEVPFDPSGVALWVNEVPLYRSGMPLPFDEEFVSTSIREHRETTIRLQFSEGDARAHFWTTDLTAEYVRLNADYHT